MARTNPPALRSVSAPQATARLAAPQNQRQVKDDVNELLERANAIAVLATLAAGDDDSDYRASISPALNQVTDMLEEALERLAQLDVPEAAD